MQICKSIAAHLFNFLCSDFCFFCLLPVSCISNVAIVSGLFFIDWPFVFSYVYKLLRSKPIYTKDPFY